jgi:L-methionine (R)-S-oxide reductase
MNKATAYTELLRTVEALIEGEDDLISVMSTISCELFHAFEHWNWVGFYRRVDARTLKVGPYQGGHGCLVIDIDRGVCGACAREARIQLENDVSKVPFHIACSASTQAEIVLPICDASGEVRAVLDIDSVQRDVFDETDVAALQQICRWVAERYV